MNYNFYEENFSVSSFNDAETVDETYTALHEKKTRNFTKQLTQKILAYNFSIWGVHLSSYR